MSQNIYVLALLKDNPAPSVEDLINCNDIVQVFKTGNQQLLDILISEEGINELIRLLQTTNSFQIARRILQIFIMVDSPLLSQLINSNEYTENLLSIFDDLKLIHPYIVGSITQILFTALDSYPGDFYESMNSSRTIIPRIVRNLEFRSVYYLCTRIVITSIEAQTFCWYLFVSLMGEHGPGCAVPKSFAADPPTNLDPFPLNSQMRRRALELLFSFINEFPDTCDFYSELSVALPIILQDAADDYERSLVFKLGLLLNINEAIAYSAQSVLNCLKSSDLLIQSALYYIDSFGIIIRNNSVELILYRLLHRTPNNFILIVLSKMIQSIIEGGQTDDNDNSDLTETLQMIVADAYQSSDKSSLIMKAFRACLHLSSEGEDVDPEGPHIIQQLKLFNEGGEEIEVDTNYIQDLKRKADTIDQTKTIQPEFSVAKLWEPNTYKEMEERFKSLGPAVIKDSTASADEPRPDIPKQERSPARIKTPTLMLPSPPRQIPQAKPVQVAQQTKPVQKVDDDEEDSYSDGYYDEESEDENDDIRATIERQKAAKLQAESMLHQSMDQGPEIYDTGVTMMPSAIQNVQRMANVQSVQQQQQILSAQQNTAQHKSPAVLNLPAIPPAPKPVENKLQQSHSTSSNTTTKGKGRKGKGKKGKKGKGKAKGKSQTAKPNLGFTMNVGVIDSPPSFTSNNGFTLVQPVNNRPFSLSSQKTELELNISSLKLKPRKPRPVFDKKVLVIDCPLKKPVLEINETNSFQKELDDMSLFSFTSSPKKKLSSEEIQKMLAQTNDPEEDFDIEPLPSEMEEEDGERRRPPLAPPKTTLIRNPFGITSIADEDDEEEEEEERKETQNQENAASQKDSQLSEQNSTQINPQEQNMQPNQNTVDPQAPQQMEQQNSNTNSQAIPQPEAPQIST